MPIKLSKGFDDCVFWDEAIWLLEDDPKRLAISFVGFELDVKGFTVDVFCIELDEVIFGSELKRLIISSFGFDWEDVKLLVVADGSPPKIVVKRSTVFWEASEALVVCLTLVTIPSLSRSKSDYYKQSAHN